MRQVGVLYRPWRFVGSDRWRALHPGDWPPGWPGLGAGSPGIRGWTPHSQAQCWTHWPAPLQRSPGRFAPGGNPLTRCRWTRTGFVALAGSSGSGAARLHLSKLPPACGPGDGGFAPPTQNRPLGRPGHTVPRWTRVTPCALLIGAPQPPSAPCWTHGSSGGVPPRAAPQAAPRCHRCARWPRLPPLFAAIWSMGCQDALVGPSGQPLGLPCCHLGGLAGAVVG